MCFLKYYKESTLYECVKMQGKLKAPEAFSRPEKVFGV